MTFDMQSGSGGTTSVTATYDSEMPTISVPTRAGYKFNGYYSEENGKGTKYYDAKGEGVKKWNIASDTTLYAYWTPNKLNIVFNANGANSIQSKVINNSNTYYWKLDTNGNITRSTNGTTYNKNFYSKNYTSTNIDLPNYDNSTYIKLTKT
ncbi:MAG: InlB B-repeat-containing protein, partial [Agathobacter sp.]